MKEYSQRTIDVSKDIGEYLTEQAKEGWEVQHIQRSFGGRTRPSNWYIILVRDSEQEAED